MKSKVWVIFWLVIDLIYTLFFGVFIRSVVDFGNKNDVKFWYVCVISGLVFTAISVLTFVLMKKGKKGMLCTSICTKIGAIIITFGLMCSAATDDSGAVAIFLGILGGIFILLAIYVFYCKNNKYQFAAEKNEHGAGLNSADFFILVYDECLRQNIFTPRYTLKDEDKAQIHRYAATPFSYVLYWLLRNNMLKQSFYSENDEVSANDVIQGFVTPLEYYEKKCGFYMEKFDISDEGRIFLDRYYFSFFEIIHSVPDEDFFFYDYAEAIRNEYGVFWTAEFDWEICRKMYDKISERFEQFSFRRESELDVMEFQDNEGSAFWKSKDAQLTVKSMNPVSEDIIRKCENDLNSISDFQIAKFERMIYEEYYAEEAFQDFMPDAVYVFENEKGETAYAISGLTSYEEENGIFIYVRNGIIIDYTIGCFFIDPFDRNEEYENEKLCIDFSGIEDESVLKKLVFEKKITKVQLDERQECYMTLPAKAVLEECRRCINILQIMGLADDIEYECECEPDDSVPKCINVTAQNPVKSGKSFSKTVRIRY